MQTATAEDRTTIDATPTPSTPQRTPEERLARLLDQEAGIPWALREIEAMVDYAETAEDHASKVKHYAEAAGHRNRRKAFKAAASLIRQALQRA